MEISISKVNFDQKWKLELRNFESEDNIIIENDFDSILIQNIIVEQIILKN